MSRYTPKFTLATDYTDHQRADIIAAALGDENYCQRLTAGIHKLLRSTVASEQIQGLIALYKFEDYLEHEAAGRGRKDAPSKMPKPQTRPADPVDRELVQRLLELPELPASVKSRLRHSVDAKVLVGIEKARAWIGERNTERQLSMLTWLREEAEKLDEPLSQLAVHPERVPVIYELLAACDDQWDSPKGLQEWISEAVEMLENECELVDLQQKAAHLQESILQLGERDRLSYERNQLLDQLTDSYESSFFDRLALAKWIDKADTQLVKATNALLKSPATTVRPERVTNWDKQDAIKVATKGSKPAPAPAAKSSKKGGKDGKKK
jgi:hypothetical protein